MLERDPRAAGGSRTRTPASAVLCFGSGRELGRWLSLLALMLGLTLGALAQPAGYYDGVDPSDPVSLRLTLHEAIDDHTWYPYTDSSTDTWNIVNLADEDPNNSNNILDVYRNASYTKISGGTGAYNREHSWPKSYGFPDLNSSNYPYTDCHHLFASDASYNSSRSNRPYRWCDAGCSEKTTDVNDGRGGGSGAYPGNSNWTSGSFTQGTWETWSGRRGDVARALLYMDVRYEGDVHAITGVAEPDLVLTDDEALIDASNTGSNESVAYMGMLSVLLEWHQLDPPDALEIWRNEVVYSYQGNRNPFIDHPEWVSCIFESLCSTDTTPPAAPGGLMGSPLNGGADLSWIANSESDLAGYHVYRATSAGGPYSRVTGALLTINAFTDAGLSNGTTYYYVVTALDASGNESADSAEVAVTPDGGLPDTTPPAPPTGVAAAAGDGEVGLTWDASAESDLDGYHVYRANAPGGPYARVSGALLATNGFTDTGLSNGTTYHYVVTALDVSGNESADSAEVAATPSAPGGGGVVLSEVLYDVSSGDDGWEWIELYNAGGAPVDLSAHCLGGGGTDYTYTLVQLSGTIGAGQTFVVGGPSSGATNANPSFDQALNFSPDLQNSGSAGDGVALFDRPCAQVGPATVPIDAVVYGPNNANGLIDESGAANAPEVGDASPGSSIERVDLAGAWQIQASPTPNAASFGPPPANTAPTVSITAPADGSSVEEGTVLAFAGSASDAEDGDLGSALAWTSSLDGAIGSGSSFSTSLSVGTHTITATVTDSGGLPGSDAISVTVTAAPPGGPTTVVFTSSGGEDGWVRESSESSNVGGRATSTGSGTSALRAGDDRKDRQLKAIVSFDTSALPEGAVITEVKLRLRRGTVNGSNPFTTHGSAWVDVAGGAFGGSTALADGDFEAAASVARSAVLSSAAADGDWSEASLDAAGMGAVATDGSTQLRVYFDLDDDDDRGNDYVGFYSGDNGDPANHPQLVVTYE